MTGIVFGCPFDLSTPEIGVAASSLVSAVNELLPKKDKAQAVPFQRSPPSLQSRRNPNLTSLILKLLFQPNIKSGFGSPIALWLGSTA